MNELASIFGRAFLQVALVSANVSFLAQHNGPMAFATSFGLSYTWWGNARSAAHVQHPWARYSYALGAAVGTVTGMVLAGYWR
jgi:hypothetical protein